MMRGSKRPRLSAKNKAPRLRAVRTAVRSYNRIKGPIPVGRAELKFVDLATADYAMTTTAVITPLNLIAVGDDDTSRDGRQVTIKSVQIHGMIFPNDTATDDSKCRIMLVWDNANNSSSGATITDILAANDVYSFPNVNNQNRFTILKDYLCTQGSVTAAGYNTPCIDNVEIYLKLNSVTQYSGTSAALNNIQNGALLMVTMGGQPAGSSATFRAATRVRFVDN